MRIATGLVAALISMSATVSFAAEPAMQADSGMGKIYTDSKGMTLYTFDKDEAGKSNCNDKCAATWPPFKAAAGAMAEDEWTIVKRTDGTAMWAYDGKPVYTYGKDQKAGDATGDGFGGLWHAAKPD